MQDQPPQSATETRSLEQVFATRMRELRRRKAWSQAELAERLFTEHGIKLDDSAITRIEKNAEGASGARILRLGEAFGIADTLGVEIHELLRLARPLHVQLAQAEEQLAMARTAAEVAIDEQRRLQQRARRATESPSTSRAAGHEIENAQPSEPRVVGDSSNGEPLIVDDTEPSTSEEPDAQPLPSPERPRAGRRSGRTVR